MNILFGSLKQINSYLQVGASFYAREFDKNGHRVVFFSDPLNPLHIFRDWLGKENRRRMESFWNNGIKFGNNSISLNPITFFPSYGIFPFSAHRSIRLSQLGCLPNPKSFCEKQGMNEVDILWIDNVYYSFLLDLIPHKISIYRISDEIHDFLRYGYGHYELEKQVMERVDIVYGVFNNLVEKAKRLRPNKPTYLLPNGVEIEPFTKNQDPEPEAYLHIPRPRVVYVGSINKLFNPELFFNLARMLPQFSFVMMGPKNHSVSIPKLSNLYYLGPIIYEQLPPYLLHADVGLSLLDFQAHQACTMQLKTYQYMACKLPNVCSSFDAQDFEDYDNPPCLYANSLEDMARKIEQALHLPEHEKIRMLQYAQNNTWSKRFERVKETVNELGILKI